MQQETPSVSIMWWKVCEWPSDRWKHFFSVRKKNFHNLSWFLTKFPLLSSESEEDNDLAPLDGIDDEIEEMDENAGNVETLIRLVITLVMVYLIFKKESKES